MFDVEFAENEVITLLCDPRLEGIAFELGGVTIARSDFRRVARRSAATGSAWRSGRRRTSPAITRATTPSSCPGLPGRTPGRATFGTSRGSSSTRPSTLRDIEHTGRPIAATLDEAVAYVAQQYWYYLNGDAAPTVRSHEGTPDWIIESVLADARAIAETLGSRSPVTTASLDALRSRISALTFWDPTRGRFICPYSATEERTYDGV